MFKPSLWKQFEEVFGHPVEDVIDRDYRPLVITEELRNYVLSHPLKFRDVRIAHGYFLTDEERRAKIERLRQVELP